MASTPAHVTVAGSLVVLVYIGVPPLVATIATILTCVAAAARRWGVAFAAAAITVLWMAGAFLAASLAPVFSVPLPIAFSAAHVLALAAAFASSRRELSRRPPRANPRAVVASLLGPLAWLVGLVAARAMPSGSGLSWATHIDSSVDVWYASRYWYRGGIVAGSESNPRPLEHTLTASLLPPDFVVESSERGFSELLLAHASAWSLLIVAAAALAGLLVAELGASSRRTDWIVVAMSSATSLMVVASGVTGELLVLGQINAHLIIATLLASAILGALAERSPAAAVGLLGAATTVLMLSWTPFAAGPAVVAIVVAWRHRAGLKARPTESAAWIGASAVLFAWGLSGFAIDSLLGALRRAAAGTSNVTSVVAYSGALNPVWLPMTAVVVLATIAMTAACWRSASRAAYMSVGLLGGLSMGVLVIVLERGGLSGDLGYYPSKYLSLMTIALVPLVVALSVRSIGAAQSRRGVVPGAAAIATLAAFSLVAPTNSAIAWQPVTVPLATGDGVASHEELAGRVISQASESVLVIPWRLDPEWDFAVQWMGSALLPRESGIWNSPLRAALRMHLNDFSADAACAVAEAADVPVILLTEDSTLDGEIDAVCPSSGVSVATRR